MSVLSTALTILAAGVVLQNVIFARGFCTDDILRATRTRRTMLQLGYTTTAIAVLATFLTWLARRFLAAQPFWTALRWLFCFLCVLLAYILLHAAAVFRSGRKLTREQTELLLQAGFNGAAFGIVLIAAANYNPLWQMLLYAFGCSVGLTAAQMLIHAGHERIALCAVPKPFAGVPIIMIYIGILSLAIYGLIGHQLPT